MDSWIFNIFTFTNWLVNTWYQKLIWEIANLLRRFLRPLPVIQTLCAVILLTWCQHSMLLWNLICPGSGHHSGPGQPSGSLPGWPQARSPPADLGWPTRLATVSWRIPAPAILFLFLGPDATLFSSHWVSYRPVPRLRLAKLTTDKRKLLITPS